MNKPKYIIDTIDHFISGDWGNEEASSDAPNRVRCVRGADINSANENNNASIPTRYISDSSKQKKLLSAGNIIVEKSGGSPTQSTGRVAYISDSIINNEDVVCSNFCAAFKVKDEYDPKYIYYYLKYMYNLGVFFNFEGKTSGIKNLQLEQAYGAIPTKDIKLPYQQKITSVLSALDKKIELNNKIIKELETMSKELYDYWFVQFDFPNKDGKPYRTSGGAMTYNPTLKREIPLGWEVDTLGNYSSVKSGFAFKSEWWTNSGIPVVKIANITEDCRIDFSSCSFVASDKIDIAKECQANPFDVIIAMTGATIGKYAIIPNIGNTILVNQRVGLFNLGENPLLKLPFLINTLRQSYIRDVIFKIASGCAQPNISNADIDNIVILKPTSQLIDKYNNNCNEIYIKIINTLQQIQELTTLRDWLLPMLMNGQVAIK